MRDLQEGRSAVLFSRGCEDGECGGVNVVCGR